MQKLILAAVSLIALGVGGVYLYAQKGTQSEQVFCTQDAKLCPDGVTYVGRQGPHCEFAACPAPTTEQSATVTLKLGERKQVLGIFITPVAVLEDSRCPLDVQCIQAGTVRVKLLAESGMGNGDLTLKLNEMGTTETEEITLISVTPTKNSKIEIKDADYRFTFELKKR